MSLILLSDYLSVLSRVGILETNEIKSVLHQEENLGGTVQNRWTPRPDMFPVFFCVFILNSIKKLIRDNIPEIILTFGYPPYTRSLSTHKTVSKKYLIFSLQNYVARYANTRRSCKK